MNHNMYNPNGTKMIDLGHLYPGKLLGLRRIPRNPIPDQIEPNYD